MTNPSINRYTVATIFNRIFDAVNNRLKVKINVIKLAQGQSLFILDAKDLPIIRFDSDRNVTIYNDLTVKGELKK